MAAEGTESVPDRYAVEVVMVGLFLLGLLAAVCACVCVHVRVFISKVVIHHHSCKCFHTTLS